MRHDAGVCSASAPGYTTLLWQPSLPESYLKMTPDELAEGIAARRRELGDALVILGHHYQTDEIIRHADFTGDSLKLSQIAAGLVESRGPDRRVKYVVFCGVHFMAETADMLTPDDVSVILPDLSAGCSMADMAQYDDTSDAWDAIHASLREQGWTGRIVPITYVNSSAAIKAFVGAHGGSCCTSSNARQVFEWAMRGGTEPVEPGSLDARQIKVLFLPDQHLGRNTAASTGIDVEKHSTLYDPRLTRRGQELGGSTPAALLDARVILWAGHCSVHKLFRPEHCEEIRVKNRSERESGSTLTPTRIVVHPECAKEVVDGADLAGSTEFIIKTIENAERGSRWVVGTEVHLVNRLARSAQARGVSVRILSDCQCLCTTMYRIDEPHLLWVLDHLVGKCGKGGRAKVVNQVRVHAQVREQALLAVGRMLTLSARSAERAVTVD